MANIWELFYTFAPVSKCAGVPDGTPLYDPNWQTFRVNGGPIITFGQQSSICPNTEASVRDPMITYLKSGEGTLHGYPLMTDADTIYTNGVLYYSHVSASPTHIIEFKLLENASGILETLKSYAPVLTAIINPFIPAEAGWTVYSTGVDTSRGILRLQLSPTGSWGIVEIAEFLFSIIITAIGALLLAIFLPVGLLGIAIIVAAVLVLDYVVYRIIDYNVELQQKVTNLQAKDQNDTKLDQTVAGVLDLYEKSAKTKDDCLNKLNGLRISYTTYLDTMQKNFPNLYTPPMKLTFQSTADNAIAQFRDDKITCERAAEIITTSGALAKSDVSTNFTANYNTITGYTQPKKDCWISKPLSEDCILSASTGKWITGSAVVLIGLGIAYWAVTRKPAETRLIFERAKRAAVKGGEMAKAEYGRMKTAYSTIRAPAVPATARVAI